LVLDYYLGKDLFNVYKHIGEAKSEKLEEYPPRVLKVNIVQFYRDCIITALEYLYTIGLIFKD
jgi:serine/threonine protein kinase